MPAKHRDLFDGIASFTALRAAALRAAKGKRSKPGAAAFLANLEKEVLRLERELRSGCYQPGRYKTIEVRDPKHRVVSAAPFRDRVVHHAFCTVCEPIFERGFIYDSYANRRGKGTHRAVARYEAFRDRFRGVLRCDVYRYFPAIDHQILKDDLRRRIACPRTLALADRIVDCSNPQEPVDLYFPGDDLFTPFERRRGLPIGNLTSQFFANLYLDGLDHFCKEVLRAKGYLRYVDDFALFDDDAGRLQEWREQHRPLPGGPTDAAASGQDLDRRDDGAGHVSGLRPVARRVPPSAGRQRAPLSQSPSRVARAMASRKREPRRGGPEGARVDRPCRTCAIAGGCARRSFAADGMIRRGRAWPSPCRRVVRGGSWNNKPRNLRSANRNRNETGNRNNNIGFRVARTLALPEPAVSRGRRECERASRDGHGEPSGGVPLAPRLAGEGRRPLDQRLSGQPVFRGTTGGWLPPLSRTRSCGLLSAGEPDTVLCAGCSVRREERS